MNKCIGCGYKLQTKDPSKLGFIPKNIDKNSYCQRCFRIIHYGDERIVDNLKLEEEIISAVNTKGKLAFFLVDFLNINNETIDTFQKFKIPKILVISKSDIIPGSMREIRLISWLKDEYAINDEIIFVSAMRNKNLGTITNLMNDYMINSAYILGYTNAGKSSLINRIYEMNQNEKSSITTSIIPNTTMDFISLKITDNITLIDSPGFILKNNIYENDEISLIKKVNSKTFLKPITYQMKNNESILLEDKFRFMYLSENKNSFTFYVSGQIDLDKIFTTNNNLLDLDYKEIKVQDNTDLVIKGVGFINIKKSCLIKVYSKHLDLLEIRSSIFRK